MLRLNGGRREDKPSAGEGDDGVSMGNVLSVLWTLGLLQTARAMANPETDEHGKSLELARLPERGHGRGRGPAPDNDF